MGDIFKLSPKFSSNAQAVLIDLMTAEFMLAFEQESEKVCGMTFLWTLKHLQNGIHHLFHTSQTSEKEYASNV